MATQKIPTLVGIGGYSKGEKYPLKYGKTLVVGRSRSADFSLRRLESYLSLPAEERDADDKFRTVSGRHFEITMYNLESIELKNLSPNGTLVDGNAVDATVFDDVSENTHLIEIGMEEKLSLEMVEHEVGADGEPVAESGAIDLSKADEDDPSSVDASPVEDDEAPESEKADDADGSPES